MSFGDYLSILPHLPTWVPVGWLVFGGLLWLVAYWIARLSLKHPPHTKAVAGWLRHPRYTQLYQWACKPAVDHVWTWVCDAPPPKNAGWPAIFKEAITWRLYEKALVFAVMYPLLAAIAFWLWTGNASKAGGANMLPAEHGIWRFLSLAPIPVSILFFKLKRLIVSAMLKRGLVWSDWRNWISVDNKLIRRALTFAFILVLILVVFTIGFVFIVSLDLISKFAGDSTGMVAFVIALSVVIASIGEGALALVFLGLLGLNTIDIKLGGGAFMIVSAAASAKKKLPSWLFYPLHILAMSLCICGTVWFLPIQSKSAVQNSYFVFFTVFPLINGVFDWVSYSATLSLLYRGQTAAWPFLWGLLDLIVACVLFLLLGITLVAVLHGLDMLAGGALVDLPALLGGLNAIKHGDWSHSWALFMVFSTMVPTGLHVLISLIGLQGLWPAKWRRKLAGWIEVDAPSPLAQAVLPMALGVVWAAPIVAGCAVIWALIQWGKPLLGGFFQWYFDVLMWVAQLGGVV